MPSFSRSTTSILLVGALALVRLSTSSTHVTAFSFSEITSKQAERARNRQLTIGYIHPSESSSALGVSTTTRSTDGLAEEDAEYIFSKAREFAFRDDFSSVGKTKGSGNGNTKTIYNEYDQHYHGLADEIAEIEESRYWLREIIHVQSGCVTGTLAGQDVCENQDQAAEIVARLRKKIEILEKRVAVRTRESESVVPTIATELIIGALLVVVGMFWTTLELGQRHDDIPLMANYNEWISILKDKGYIN